LPATIDLFKGHHQYFPPWLFNFLQQKRKYISLCQAHLFPINGKIKLLKPSHIVFLKNAQIRSFGINRFLSTSKFVFLGVNVREV
jgi:hypothetical protein